MYLHLSKCIRLKTIISTENYTKSSNFSNDYSRGSGNSSTAKVFSGLIVNL